MQFFPFAGLAVNIVKSVVEEIASGSGVDKTALKNAGSAASKKGESKKQSFEDVLERLGARNRKEESAGNGEKQRIAVDPRTGRVVLVNVDDEDGGEDGKDGEKLLLPELKQNGEAAGALLKARILKAAKENEKGSSSDDSGPAGDLKKALRALMSSGKAEFSPDKIKLTKEDFAALKSALAEFGLSEADIKAIGDKVESKAGLTWSAFASMLGKLVGKDVLAGAGKITQAQSRNLQNFFQKLGFTPQQSAALINDLKNGKFEKVWKEVSTRVAQAPENSTFVLDAGEIETLAEVMNLSDKARSRLVGLLSGAEGGRVGKPEMRLLAAVLSQEAAERGAGNVKNLETLREAVAAAFKLARDREAAMANASAEEDGKARTYKVLASESREADNRENGEKNDKPKEGEVASRWLGKSGDKDKAADSGKAEPKGRERAGSESDKSSGKMSNGDRGEGGLDAGKKVSEDKAKADRFESVRESRADKAEEPGAKGNEKGSADNNGKGTSADDKRAMQEFLLKIRRDAADEHSGANGKARFDPAAVADKAVQAAQAQNKAFEVLHQADQGPARQVLSQVQSGMLKAISGGRQQLTLRLNPPDLGKVHLMLQVTKNEVNAVIRADSHDSAKMIADQLAQLRSSLESQGLKVSRLEVQTQTQQQQQSQDQQYWQNAEQHNQAREQAQRAGLSGRWSRTRGGSEALAQEMHNPEETAINSRQGIDIFA